MTASEQQRYAELLTTLSSLRGRGAAGWHPWRFADRAPIRIICGTQDPSVAPVYSDPDNNNYMELCRYADLDALVELYGQLLINNPGSDVRYRIVNELDRVELSAHLVVVGNLSLLQDVDELFTGLDLPVRQVGYEGLDGEVFEVRRPNSGEPQWALPTFFGGPGGRLKEDVGLLVRMPSPLHHDRTLVLCSGVFTRGSPVSPASSPIPTSGRRTCSGCGRGSTDFPRSDCYSACRCAADT